jgi:hypothetical protein
MSSPRRPDVETSWRRTPGRVFCRDRARMGDDIAGATRSQPARARAWCSRVDARRRASGILLGPATPRAPPGRTLLRTPSRVAAAAGVVLARPVSPASCARFARQSAGRAPRCARKAWMKRKEVANQKLQIATRGESPTGDEARPPRRKRVLRDRTEVHGRPWSRSVDSERAGRAIRSRNPRVVGAEPSAGGVRRHGCGDARPARLSAAASNASASRDRRTGRVRKGRPGTWDGVSTLCREIGTTRQKESSRVGRREVGARSRSCDAGELAPGDPAEQRSVPKNKLVGGRR